MASAGNGTPGHVAGELFRIMAGIDLVHVPYRGAAPALSDLLGGQVQMLVSSLPASLEQMKVGRVRALAVTTLTRLDLLPELPAVAELLPGYEAVGWTGIGAPKGTPAPIIERLNKEINAALADARIKTRLAEIGGVPLVTSPDGFRKFIIDETDKWGKVIRSAGIKPD